MVQPDVAEIRKMLQVFDQSSSLSPSQAVRMLKSITRSIAKDPEAYDLLTDPGTTDVPAEHVCWCALQLKYAIIKNMLV
jgi:hypothetical protein